MLPCDVYRLLWHGVAMPRGNVRVLSAGHVAVLVNGGYRFLLRIVKFSYHTLRHFVTAARTSRLESLGFVMSQTDIRGVNLSGNNINALLHGQSNTRYNP